MTSEAALPGQDERRRSPRHLLDVALMVRGESMFKEPFQEETFTISVSAHGALVVLAKKVNLGQQVSLENLKTHAKIDGRVARFGPPYGGLAQVGIEFVSPSPEFWTIPAQQQGFGKPR